MDVGSGSRVPVGMVTETRMDSPRPVVLNRKLRRTLAALKRRANRRLLREAYRELRTLRRAECYRPFETNDLERFGPWEETA